MNVGLLYRQPLGNALRPLCAQATLPRYSSTAAAETAAPTDAAPPTYPDALTRPVVRDDYRIMAATVLSRPPFLTPELSDFEESYYFYQRRLNQKLALPFTRYFYFKDKSPADLEWKRKQKAAQEYTGFGKMGWADELLVGDDRHKEADFGYKRLVATTVTGEDAAAEEGVEESEADKKKKLTLPVGRVSKADLENDLRSLNRAGSRTLYLLVKQRDMQKWKFPSSQLIGRENLREAAERTLADAAGVNMNTWFVGNVPIGHEIYTANKNYKGPTKSEKTFFMKARILGGQADVKDSKLNIEDYMWLSKEEIPKYVSGAYYNAVEDMLVTR